MSYKWDYGDAYLRHPCQSGPVRFADGSVLQVHDIFNPLPDFMRQADILFTDGPWNAGNMRSFYTKAELMPTHDSFDAFAHRLFECVGEISPRICYLEVGKEYLADYIMFMRHMYRYVTFYNSSYYHRSNNHCYIVCGSRKRCKAPLDGVDEENAIEWICEHEDYNCIADLCMGRGLVAINAYKAGKRFLGTELNHKRLAVCIERLSALGATYSV